MSTSTPHTDAAYIKGFNAALLGDPCGYEYYPEGPLQDAYVSGYDRAMEIRFRDTEPPTNEDTMTYEYNAMERRAFGSGYHHGASGDEAYNIYAVGSKAYDAYAEGYDEGTENYEDTYAPVPVRPEGWEPTIADDHWELTDDLSKQERLEADGWKVGNVEDFLANDLLRFEQNAWKVGYHHALTGSDAYNVYQAGTMAHALYDEGYEAGAKEYNSDEDFPEHEGLDNQDYFADMPDEVILDEDEVVERVAEKWKLNEYEWNDDTPAIAIQLKDGGVYEAFSTTPIRLYIIAEDSEEADIPEGLKLDEGGTLNYASKWARGNVEFNPI